MNGKLNVYSEEPDDILLALANRHHSKAIYWNCCYEPWRIALDKKIKINIQQANITSCSFAANPELHSVFIPIGYGVNLPEKVVQTSNDVLW